MMIHWYLSVARPRLSLAFSKEGGAASQENLRMRTMLEEEKRRAEDVARRARAMIKVLVVRLQSGS